MSSVTVEMLAKEGDVSAVCDMAKAMLKRQKRQLTDKQWAVFKKAVNMEPTALYVNLAVNNIKINWNSLRMI